MLLSMLSGQREFNAFVYELLEARPIADDPPGDNRVLLFDMALREVFQTRYICFAKKLSKDPGWEPEGEAKVSARNEDIPVHIAGNRSETIFELQAVTDREPGTNTSQKLLELT